MTFKEQGQSIKKYSEDEIQSKTIIMEKILIVKSSD